MLAIRREDLVKQEDGESWIEAEKVADLKDLFADCETETADSGKSFSDDRNDNVTETEGSGSPESQELTSKSGNMEVSPYNPFSDRPQVKIKKSWLYIGLGALLLVIMAMTNPARHTHYDKVETMICTGIVNNGYDGSRNQFANYILSSFVSKMVEQTLDWHDCTLFSYTTINEEIYAERNIVTFGIFGHVFSISQDKMDKYIGNAKNQLNNYFLR